MSDHHHAMPNHVRLAQLTDEPAIEALIQAASRKFLAIDYTPRQIDSFLQFALVVDRQLILDQTYFVVEQNRRLIGAGGWSFRPHSIRPDQTRMFMKRERLDPFTEPAVLRLFFVHPDFARRGIGRLLVSTAEGAVSAAGYRWVDLTATLSGAPLYLACGFDIAERFEAKFPDGVAASGLRMVKTLKRSARDDRQRPKGTVISTAEGTC
jgi:GNAT superfamily N-acetyltransferase